MKQLRNRADEDARLVHMSLQMDSELPSSLRKDLDHLMTLVSLLYTPLHIFTLTNFLKHMERCVNAVSRNLRTENNSTKQVSEILSCESLD